MAPKVLVNALGQHILADVKQVENKDTGEIVGYWLGQPRLGFYNQNQETNEISINFGPYCLVSNEQEFSVRAEHIVSILEPRPDVVEGWTNLVYPQTDADATEVTELDDTPPEEVNELDSTAAPEDGTSPGLTD